MVFAKGTGNIAGAKVFGNDEFVVLVPICQRCNNGWLSDLETQLSAVLKPMVQGVPTRLSQRHQALVTRWALKTAALMDHSASRRFQLLPHDLFPALLEGHTTKRPPPLTEAHIGYLPDAHFTVELTVTSSRDVPLDPLSPDVARQYWIGDYIAFRIVLSVGKVFIEVTGTNVDAPVRLPRPPAFKDALLPIWPSTDAVEWPPPNGLTVDALWDFSLTLGSEFAFRQTPGGLQPFLRLGLKGSPGAPVSKFAVGEYVVPRQPHGPPYASP
jgi:hypothetical protein